MIPTGSSFKSWRACGIRQIAKALVDPRIGGGFVFVVDGLDDGSKILWIPLNLNSLFGDDYTDLRQDAQV
jgi:hypothetical protein